MGDILSSASLLLAIVAMFCTLWLPEINLAAATLLPEHKDDCKTIIKYLKSTFQFKAFPLCLFSILLFLLFLPPTIGFISEGITLYKRSGFIPLVVKYNVVKVSICFVSGLNFGIFIVLLSSLLRLHRTLKDAESLPA